ncbi:MAG: haloacid dehalogenase-like hydrolase [Gammaproteobacteria bacterium]|nr:haloacid dehalogenase-like hydrolase [Gammaproteobacteria bacterium]
MTTKNANRIVAIIYDFDGTLAPGNMQEHGLLEKYGIDKKEFWRSADALAKLDDMDGVLAYMQLLIKRIRDKDAEMKRSVLTEHGCNIKLFDGILAKNGDPGWFDRIKSYGNARDIDVDIEHYIISSGLEEMIKSTPIEKYFKKIYASKYKYKSHNTDDIAEWPALAINYTCKIQYLFRINKGILNSWDNKKINQYMAENKRRIPFSNMIYVGDGDTDIPCMKMISHQGGYSLAVYNPKPTTKINGLHKCRKLVWQERANYAAAADYSRGSELENIIQTLVRKIAAEMDLKDLKPPESSPPVRKCPPKTGHPTPPDTRPAKKRVSSTTKPV